MVYLKERSRYQLQGSLIFQERKGEVPGYMIQGEWQRCQTLWGAMTGKRRKLDERKCIWPRTNEKNGEEREKKRGSKLNNLPREIFYIIIILSVPTTTCRAITIPRPSVTRAALYPARNESPQISNDLISHVFSNCRHGFGRLVIVYFIWRLDCTM